MKTLIIAEAGVNHNGDINLAKKLIDKAKECGADIIKFQTAKLDALVSKNAKMAEYQKINTKQDVSQKEMLSKLILSYDDFKELKAYCESVGIEFLSSAFDLESVEFLHDLGCSMWKIPSGEITNLPYLEKIAGYNQKIIMSTGMSSVDEIREAIIALRKKNTNEIVLLHCTTEYPAPFNEVNLLAMQNLAKEFSCSVGYSDHTRGIEVPIAAVALGASVIEKHFTLNRNMEGPDHKASIEPDDFKKMVDSIRNIELALGDGIKRPMDSEITNKAVARKSIVASKDIKKGELFTEDNITTKRPGNGISPMKWYDILGTKASKDYCEDDLIEY